VRRILLLWVALWLGCESETTLLLDLRLTDGMPQPSALRISLFHDGLLHRSTVATTGRVLPGTLIVRNLRPGPALRTQVDGLDGRGDLSSQAAQLVDIQTGPDNKLLLTLGPPLADADGDGVPDVIDDCPQRPDPDQKCAGTTPQDDLSVPQLDLAGLDLAQLPDLRMPPDLSGIDLFGADLSPGACPAGAVLCDDFELGTDARWTPGLETGKPLLPLTIDMVRPHSGAWSLHGKATLSDLGGTWNKSIEHDFTIGTTFAFRAWIYSQHVLDDYTLILAFYNASDEDSINIGGGDGVLAVAEYGSAGYNDFISSIPFPVGQWTCLELVFDGTQAHVYTDSIERIVYTSSFRGPPARLAMGYQRWPTPRDNEIFFDDVVVATDRVGCQ
jgi:hypothetical protein